MRPARAIDECDEWKYGGIWNIDTQPVLIQKTCLKSRRKYTQWERRSLGVNMLRCWLALCSHACMHASALDMSETFTLHTNRATANRWGEGDSSCTCESNCGLSSRLSTLISNQPTSTTPLVPGHMMPKIRSSGFIDHRNHEPRLLQRSRYSIGHFAWSCGVKRMIPIWRTKRFFFLFLSLSLSLAQVAMKKGIQVLFTITYIVLTAVIGRVS